MHRSGKHLRVRLGARRITYAADMIRAAGLALTVRSLTSVPPGQPPGLRTLCAWVDEKLDQGALAEAVLNRQAGRQAAAPAPEPGVGFGLLCLDTLCDLLSDLSPERAALLRICTRDWLEVPRSGGCREVPIAYVGEHDQRMVNDTLVVEFLTPGHGQTMQHPEDVFVLPEQPIPAPERCVPDTMDPSFLAAMQHAFQATCTLAPRHDVDARWRLLRGPGRQPVRAAQGGSASGQSSRAPGAEDAAAGTALHAAA